MLISVIVPVYKVEKYIDRCVNSILKQTFKDFELILVDDGSPDNCGKICDEYAKKDDRIIVIHKTNGGLSDARNAGIDWAMKNSNSEWITFIDSDDWVYVDYLLNLLTAAVDNNVDISVCSYINTTGETNVEKENCPPNIELRGTEEFFINNNVNAVVAWGKLYKKNLWIDIRYPFGKIHEDEFTTYKLLFKNKVIAYVDLAMYYYYTNPNSITNGEWTPKRLDALQAFEERVKFFENNGYFKLCQWEANRLLTFYYEYYIKILNGKENLKKKKLIRNIKKRFYKFSHKYNNKYFINQDKFESILNTFSPIRCKIYAYKKAFLRLMK